MTCLAVHLFALTPHIDALADLALSILILKPSLTTAERHEAARRVLAQAGVPQPDEGAAVCTCGEPMRLDFPNHTAPSQMTG